MPKVRRSYTRWMKDYGKILLVSDDKESIHVFIGYKPAFIVHRWSQMRQNQCYTRWRGMVQTFQKIPTVDVEEINAIVSAFDFDIWPGGRRLGKLKLFGIKDFTNRKRVLKERRKNGQGV